MNEAAADTMFHRWKIDLLSCLDMTGFEGYSIDFYFA